VRLAFTALERLAILAASLALSVGLIILLSGFFAGRDQAGISGAAPAGPGQVYPDQGDAHLRPGDARPRYNSDPPTSGAHVPAAVNRDEARLSNDQLLSALETGDVVFVYGSRKPPSGLPALERSLAAPFTPALAGSGQAVILARRPRTSGIVGAAWAHLVRVPSASDPLLRQFAEFWLGRGAPGRSAQP
jgi:hypothetical protein